jgi:hypothetical protein
VVQLPLDVVGGSVAVHAAAGASVHVRELTLWPATEPTRSWLRLVAADGVAGGGSAAIGGWAPCSDTGGCTGYRSAGGPSTLAKFSFVGVAARLWLPRGPSLGAVTVSVDGNAAALINLTHAVDLPPAVLYNWSAAAGDDGRAGLLNGHALKVRWARGAVAVDVLDFMPAR